MQYRKLGASGLKVSPLCLGLNNQLVHSVIAGPRTYEHWTDYLGALNHKLDDLDEALIDSLVKPGHPSTPGYFDPRYPFVGRIMRREAR